MTTHWLSLTARLHRAAYQGRLRARNREGGRCINDNQSGTHGPATHGVRCAACADVHRRAR